MADPITAHGWTVYPDCIAHVASRLTTTNRLGRPGPRAGLARCIEDAATLAKVRDLAARVDNWCQGCRRPVSPHLEDLLDLLTGDGTP